MSSKISFIIISMLVFAIFGVLKVESECDEGMCNDACQSKNLNGKCNGNDECDCSNGEKCSDMVEIACGYFCDKLELDGECDENGFCVCKAELKPCFPTECEEQCLDDPRAKECVLVVPFSCMKYGPFQACVCICYQSQLTSVHKKGFYYFGSIAGQKSSQYDNHFLAGNNV